MNSDEEIRSKEGRKKERKFLKKENGRHLRKRDIERKLELERLNIKRMKEKKGKRVNGVKGKSQGI